jgi:hypothetical protein
MVATAADLMSRFSDTLVASPAADPERSQPERATRADGPVGQSVLRGHPDRKRTRWRERAAAKPRWQTGSPPGLAAGGPAWTVARGTARVRSWALLRATFGAKRVPQERAVVDSDRGQGQNRGRRAPGFPPDHPDCGRRGGGGERLGGGSRRADGRERSAGGNGIGVASPAASAKRFVGRTRWGSDRYDRHRTSHRVPLSDPFGRSAFARRRTSRLAGNRSSTRDRRGAPTLPSGEDAPSSSPSPSEVSVSWWPILGVRPESIRTRVAARAVGSLPSATDGDDRESDDATRGRFAKQGSDDAGIVRLHATHPTAGQTWRGGAGRQPGC